MALFTQIPVTSSLSIWKATHHQSPQIFRKRLLLLPPHASLGPSSPSPSPSSSSSSSSHHGPSHQSKAPLAESPSSEKGFDYALANSNGTPVTKLFGFTESAVEKVTGNVFYSLRAFDWFLVISLGVG